MCSTEVSNSGDNKNERVTARKRFAYETFVIGVAFRIVLLQCLHFSRSVAYPCGERRVGTSALCVVRREEESECGGDGTCVVESGFAHCFNKEWREIGRCND